MELEHFENLYPESARFEEIEGILEYIKQGYSCQVASVAGVGRSNLLGFLAYNKKIKLKHLGKNQDNFHFVLLNFSEVRRRSLKDVNKFIFLGILDSLRQRGMSKAYDKVNKIFKESVELNDEMVIFSGLKKTIDYLCTEKNLTLTLLFDRFEEYIPYLTSDFFANLRVLRNRAKYHFSAVFSLNKPLEDLIEPMLFADFFEYVAQKIIYLKVLDKPGLDFRISYLKKITGKKIDKKLIDEVLNLTGGHGRLTILSLEAILSSDKNILKNKIELINFLLTQRPIRSSLFAIWYSLNPSEQQYFLNKTDEPESLEKCFLCKNGTTTIPIFEEFIKDTISNSRKNNSSENANDIIYDENTNEIKRGEAIVSDSLTASEYKLLKLLISKKGKVLEKGEIINFVWGEQKTTLGVTDQALDQLIFRLRKKIEGNPNVPKYIITVKGRGFKFTN